MITDKIKKSVFRKLKNRLINYEKTALHCLSFYFEAHQFVRKNNFRKYIIFSGLSFLVLFTITIKSLLYGIEVFENPASAWLIPQLQKFLNFTEYEIGKGIQAVFWLLKRTIKSNQDAIFSGIFLVIGTPFFSFISSKTEELYSGNKYTFKWSVFLNEIKRGISISVRNSFKQIGLIILITLIALIPILEIFTPLLTFIVQAYFNGILITDYTLERHEYSIKTSEKYYSNHKPEMFALGLGFMFILLIPVIGWFLAPTYGLVASYLYFSNSNQQNDLKN